MVDQLEIKDWKAYFDALGPGVPHHPPHFTPMYAGVPSPTIVFVKGIDLEVVNITDGENLFHHAKDAYETNGGPEMWVFSHLGGPPWHVGAKPVKKKAKGGKV